MRRKLLLKEYISTVMFINFLKRKFKKIQNLKKYERLEQACSLLVMFFQKKISYFSKKKFGINLRIMLQA